MLAATKVKMGGSEKKSGQEHIKRVTRMFLEVSCCSRAKKRQRNVQKSLLHVQSCFFALLDPLIFFLWLFVASLLSITRFPFYLRKLYIFALTRASLLALAKSIL